MADAVTTNVIFKGGRKAVYQFGNASDGTGESAVVKVNLQDLTMHDGLAPDAVAITEIVWNVEGFNYVEILTERNPSNIVLLQLPAGSGYRDFRQDGNLHDPNRSFDGTGNILITTDGAADGDSYNITLHLKLYRK